MGVRKAVIAALGALALIFVAGQAPAQQVPALAPLAAADAATHKLVEKTCASCHVIAQVILQRKNADQWAGTVDKMIGYGAQVSDADYAKIVDYLAKHHGPDAASPNTK
jgi:quinoprotein glucose dehydrogenase